MNPDRFCDVFKNQRLNVILSVLEEIFLNFDYLGYDFFFFFFALVKSFHNSLRGFEFFFYKLFFLRRKRFLFFQESPVVATDPYFREVAI